MNYWQFDSMTKHNRQRILEEIDQIQLEKLALHSRPVRPGLFERVMFNFANWMISTGGQLRKHYEIPTTPCNHPPSGSFVS